MQIVRHRASVEGYTLAIGGHELDPSTTPDLEFDEDGNAVFCWPPLNNLTRHAGTIAKKTEAEYVAEQLRDAKALITKAQTLVGTGTVERALATEGSTL